MIPELGQFALILALLLAVAQGTLPLAGALGASGVDRHGAPGRHRPVPVRVARVALLATSFVNNDFSVLNVATNSNSQLPLHYRFAATWGSHEGSMLLWVLMLSGWGVAVALCRATCPSGSSRACSG